MSRPLFIHVCYCLYTTKSGKVGITHDKAFISEDLAMKWVHKHNSSPLREDWTYKIVKVEIGD